MSKYLDQMKNELIADLTVENGLLKNSNKVLINQKSLLHKRVQELDEANQYLQKVNQLWEQNLFLTPLNRPFGNKVEKDSLLEMHLKECHQEIIRLRIELEKSTKQMIWTNEGEL